MVKLSCKNCNYKFEAKEFKKKCPYCNKDNIEIELNAEELLNKL